MKRQLLLLTACFSLISGKVFAQCSTDEVEVTIEITTDQYGYETYWTLTDANGTVLLQGGEFPDGSGTTYENNTTYTESVCAPDDACLRFDLYDDFGDGILSPGGYTVSMDGSEIATGGNFDDYTFNLFNCRLDPRVMMLS